MGIFLDTGFYLGLIHPKDVNSERANEILLELKTGQFGLIYTSNLIIAEVSTLAFLRTKGNKEILNDLHELIWGNDKLASRIDVTKEQEYETWSLFNKLNKDNKGDKGFLSFVDISIIILSKIKKIDHIVSFDRHFDGLLHRIF